MSDLAKIKTFKQLLTFLEEELDWPIDEMEIDDLTFDYDPEDDLGLDPKTAAKIKAIKQLRPLKDGQPFGIFFVEFEPKRLPVTSLRRILGRLVTKKRSSANPSDRQTWSKDDLIFASVYGDDEHRRIDFAHFADDAENGLPTLRVLGWDGDDTARKLNLVEGLLKEKLTWPERESANEWRIRWRDAFVLRHREAITTSKRLAEALAHLAQRIRKQVLSSMEAESKTKGQLHKLHKAFQDSLIHDLDEARFADMYAQTIAYGLLSARMSRPAGLTADDAALMVPNTNPFLKELMEEFLRIGGRDKKAISGKGIDFDELGVNDVVELLRSVNVQAVIADFGRERPGEDPVIHFYEYFMQVYDKKEKVKRGVFYTPRPVVSFIVRSVDEILREEFGLPLGLADTTTWGEMAEREKSRVHKEGEPEARPFQIPKGVKPEEHFVQILDPATGTGTFLVETIDLIHKRMVGHWRGQKKTDAEIRDLWNEYVPEHLLPRLYGFELMMAPYAIAHMKIGLKLGDTGYRFKSEQRLRVFLTNSLEPPTDLSEMLEFVAPFLAHEARAANAVKESVRPTAVIGNPPYSGVSSNMSDWSDDLLKGRLPGVPGRRSYYEVAGEPLGEKKVWLQDDYVKFIRFGQWTIETTGCGLQCLITNHGYLDNPTFRGMRWSLMDAFDDIRVLDLHGNLKKKEAPPDGGKDVNVFDIQQGVGIGLFVRGCGHQSRIDAISVRHADLWGEREDKYRWLISHSVVNTDWQKIPTTDPFFLFEPFDQSEAGDYHDWPAINDIMLINVTGVVTARDDFVIDFDETPLRLRMADLRDASQSDQTIRDKYFDGKGARKYPSGDSRGWKLPKARQKLRDDKQWDKRYAPILYRPFDVRQIYYVPWMVDWPRTEAMPHMLAGENLGLIFMRQVAQGDSYTHFGVSRQPVDNRAFYSNKGIMSFAPLYLYPGVGKAGVSMFHAWPKGKSGRRPNLDPRFVHAIEHATGLAFASDGRGDLKPSGTFGPEDVLAYIYAVFHCPEYRRRFEPMLKLDFPRVPPPGAIEPFTAMATLGHLLLTLHLLESSQFNSPITTVHDSGDREVRRVGEKGKTMAPSPKGPGFGRVYINDSAYFDGVPEAVWKFQIGGYQVCHKWLSDRKGRTLTDEDIAHYHKIVIALNETIRIMAEIDKVIEEHGGWPGAFITDPAELEKLGVQPPGAGGSTASKGSSGPAAPPHAADRANSDKKDGPELPFA